jgi:hypothetical protein
LIYHRRRIDAFAGMKAGYRANRFGVFAKVRPGFSRLFDRGIECGGDVCALMLFAPPSYGNEFALDLGGVVEFYPPGRFLARIDVGDTLVRRRALAPPCSACTNHNFSIRFGMGVRF